MSLGSLIFSSEHLSPVSPFRRRELEFSFSPIVVFSSRFLVGVYSLNAFSKHAQAAVLPLEHMRYRLFLPILPPAYFLCSWQLSLLLLIETVLSCCMDAWWFFMVPDMNFHCCVLNIFVFLFLSSWLFFRDRVIWKSSTLCGHSFGYFTQDNNNI